jgi:O-antigen/teichoic acid export membrane protein
VNIGDLTRRVARGSGIVFAGQIAGKVIGVILQVTLSRGLGKALYGTYALAISLMKILRAVGGLGLQGGVVRFSAEAQGQGEIGRVRGTLLSTLAIGTLMSILIGAGLYLTSGWWANVVFDDAMLAPILQAFALAMPFYVLTFLTAQAARGLQSMLADVSIGIVAQPLVNVIAVSVAFLLGYTLDGAVAAFVLSSMASGLLGVWILSRIFRPLWGGVTAQFEVRRLLRYSLPVMGVGLTALFVDQADRVMIGILASTSDVGVYTIAALLATQVRFVLSAVSATFTPIISDLYHGDRHDELQTLFKITTRWIVTLSLPLAVVLALFPEPLLWIFGPEFMEGAPVVLVLTIGSFLNGATGTIGLMLQMSDNERIVLLDNVAVAVLNVGLNLWLIPIYGPLGAAIATAVSVTLINTVQVVQVRSRLGMTPFDTDLFRPLAAGTVAGVAGWGTAAGIAYSIHPPWMLDALVGMAVTGVVYAGAVIAIGLPKADWTVLTPLLRRTGLDRFISAEGED